LLELGDVLVLVQLEVDYAFLEVIDSEAELDVDFAADFVVLEVADPVELLGWHRLGEHGDKFALLVVQL